MYVLILFLLSFSGRDFAKAMEMIQLNKDKYKREKERRKKEREERVRERKDNRVSFLRKTGYNRIQKHIWLSWKSHEL